MKIKRLFQIMLLAVAFTLIAIPTKAEAKKKDKSPIPETLTMKQWSDEFITYKPAPYTKQILWVSSDPDIVSVCGTEKKPAKAYLVAKAPGTATVSCKVGGEKYSCEVTVTPNDTTIYMGTEIETVQYGKRIVTRTPAVFFKDYAIDDYTDYYEVMTDAAREGCQIIRLWVTDGKFNKAEDLIFEAMLYSDLFTDGTAEVDGLSQLIYFDKVIQNHHMGKKQIYEGYSNLTRATDIAWATGLFFDGELPPYEDEELLHIYCDWDENISHERWCEVYDMFVPTNKALVLHLNFGCNSLEGYLQSVFMHTGIEPTNEIEAASISFYNELISEARYMTDDYIICETLKNKLRTMMSYLNGERSHSGVEHVVTHDMTGVCQDYTEITMFALSLLDVDNSVGNTRAHTWNRVYINGQWYNLDVTNNAFTNMSLNEYQAIYENYR